MSKEREGLKPCRCGNTDVRYAQAGPRYYCNHKTGCGHQGPVVKKLIGRPEPLARRSWNKWADNQSSQQLNAGELGERHDDGVVGSIPTSQLPTKEEER